MVSPHTSPLTSRSTPRRADRRRRSSLQLSPSHSQSSQRSPSPTRNGRRRSRVSECESPAAEASPATPGSTRSSWLGQNLRGEGHMDDLLGKNAEQTELGKMAKNPSMKKAFFRIAMAKVATMHWLTSTGKADISNAAMEVVPAEMKEEVSKWWKVLKRRKGLSSQGYRITLAHLLEVWEAAGGRRLTADQRSVIMKKFRVKDENREINAKQFQSFCVDQMQLAQRVAGLSKANQLSKEEMILMSLMPIKDVFMSLKRHDVMMDLFQGKYSILHDGWQMEEELFQNQMQPIATMMQADRKRANALAGLSKWKNKVDLRKEKEKKKLKDNARGAANALRIGVPKGATDEELKKSSWGKTKSISESMKDLSHIEIAVDQLLIARENDEENECHDTGESQKQRSYKYINKVQTPPKDDYKLSVLRRESEASPPSSNREKRLFSGKNSAESRSSSLMSIVDRSNRSISSSARQKFLHNKRMLARQELAALSLQKQRSIDFDLPNSPEKETPDSHRHSDTGYMIAKKEPERKRSSKQMLRREHNEAVNESLVAPQGRLSFKQSSLKRNTSGKADPVKNLMRNSFALRSELGDPQEKPSGDVAPRVPRLPLDDVIQQSSKEDAATGVWAAGSLQSQLAAHNASINVDRVHKPPKRKSSRVSSKNVIAREPSDQDLSESEDDDGSLIDKTKGGDLQAEPSWLQWAAQFKPDLLGVQPDSLPQPSPSPEMEVLMPLRPGTAPVASVRPLSVGPAVQGAGASSGFDIAQWGFAAPPPPRTAPEGGMHNYGTLQHQQAMRESANRLEDLRMSLADSIGWQEQLVPGPSIARPVSAAEERGILKVARDVKAARDARTRFVRPETAPPVKDAYQDQRFSRPKSMQALSRKTGWHVAHNECNGRYTSYFRPPPRRLADLSEA